MTRILAAAVLALYAGQTQAEYTVKGIVQCPKIVTEDQNEHYRQYNKWWLMGYLTARNYAVDLLGADGLVGKSVDADEIYAMGLSFCQGNPDKSWDDAAIHVYKLLE